MKVHFVFDICVILSAFSYTFATQESSVVPDQPFGLQQPSDPNISFLKDGQLDLQAAIKHFEDLYRSTSSISEVQLKIIRPQNERTIEMKVWTQGEEKSLIVIQSPPREKNTATLKVDKNLWNYLPRINRTIRIPPSLMLSSWMGSDFTNDDLVRESSFSKDYTYTLDGHTENPAGWRIILRAKPDVVGLWNKMILIISEDGQIPIQAQYFDRKDRLSRTIYWSDVKNFGGNIIPSKMELVPEDEENKKTELIYQEINFDVTVPNEIFSLSQLERKR